VCVWCVCVCVCMVCVWCVCGRACVTTELFSSIFFQNQYNKHTFYSGESPNYLVGNRMISLVEIDFGQECVDEKKNIAVIRIPNTLYFFWVIPCRVNFMS
jgi:hypothetical protein